MRTLRFTKKELTKTPFFKLTNPTTQATLGLLIVFLLDLLFPLGIAVGVLYLFCFFLVSKESKRRIIVFAAITSILTIVKIILFFSPETNWMIFTNRTISVFTIWLTAYIVIRGNLEVSKEKSKKEEALKLVSLYQNAIDENICHSITDTNGKITYANNKFCYLSKYSNEELIGRTHRILKSGEHSDEVYKSLWETVAKGKSWRNELKNKAKDGTYFWSDSLVFPVFDNNNTIIQYMAFRFPIDDRKQMESERNEHIKSLEEMISITSHKVRQPIANCLGLMNVIDFQNPSKEDLMKIYDHIKKSATDLNIFTKELTTFMYELKEKKTKIGQPVS